MYTFWIFDIVILKKFLPRLCKYNFPENLSCNMNSDTLCILIRILNIYFSFLFISLLIIPLASMWRNVKYFQRKTYLLFVEMISNEIGNTRKYRLRRYIPGVLTYTTALDQHWGNDETLNWVLHMQLSFASANNAFYVAWLCLATWIPGVWGSSKLHIFHS